MYGYPTLYYHAKHNFDDEKLEDALHILEIDARNHDYRLGGPQLPIPVSGPNLKDVAVLKDT